MLGTNGFRRLLQTYLRPQWKHALLLLVLMLAGVALDLANPQLIRRFIDSALAVTPNRCATDDRRDLPGRNTDQPRYTGGRAVSGRQSGLARDQPTARRSDAAWFVSIGRWLVKRGYRTLLDAGASHEWQQSLFTLAVARKTDCGASSNQCACSGLSICVS
jgi:ABC-type multidrug transport system fused ATPase/permease subunit